MFFGSWADLGRVIIVGVLAYTALILVLRVSGKRTLSKMNAFDLIVTVALGSILATILLSKSVSLAEGLLAFFVLIAMQFAIAWLSVRMPFVNHLVKSEPTLLLYNGRYLYSALKAERVVEGEVHAAIRAQGIASVQSVLAVVLETDGSFTVVSGNGSSSDGGTGDASALEGVQRAAGNTKQQS